MMNLDFASTKKEVALFRDKLGCPMDPGIIDIVAALRCHNIHTIASCGGHFDRVTGGPYVMFEAPETYKFRQRYRQINDRKSNEYKFWRDKAIQANIPEVKKVLFLLNSFYEHWQSPNDQHLIVRSFDTSIGELMCQSAEIAHILTAADRKLLLQKNQTEMHAFAEYLKLKV